jgi:hypothetical protein
MRVLYCVASASKLCLIEGSSSSDSARRVSTYSLLIDTPTEQVSPLAIYLLRTYCTKEMNNVNELSSNQFPDESFCCDTFLSDREGEGDREREGDREGDREREREGDRGRRRERER